MKKMIFMMVFCAAFSLAAAAGNIEIGTYTFVGGRADVLHEESGSTTRVKEDQPVYLGDIIRTKSNSKVEVTFKDQSVLRLAPSSRVGVERYTFDENHRRQDAKVRLFRGKMRAIVSKNGDSSSFQLITPSAEGTVKGTDIYAFHQADTTGLLVKEGSMKVANPAFPDKTASLGAGDFVAVPVDGEPSSCRECLEAELSMHEKDTQPVFSKEKKVSHEGMVKIRGMVTDTGGDVRVLKSAKKQWAGAMVGMILREGDKVVTGEDGKVRIGLENGNVLALQPNSEILMKIMRQDPGSGEYDNTFESDYGKIKAIVEKLGDKSTFKVKTPTAVCAVRGTVMYLDVGQGGTDAFYEGGGGEVTSTISGDSQAVGAGQNTSADPFGNVSMPMDTTGDQRMGLDDTWEAGGSVDDYSTPGDDPGAGDVLPEGESGTGDGPTIDDILNGMNDDSSGNDTYDDVLPPPTTVENVVTPPAELAAFTGGFGTVTAFRGEGIEFYQDEATSVEGNFAFSVPGEGSKWGGTSESGNSVWGTYSGQGSYRLWGCDTDHTATDGGRMMGKTGGTMIGSSLTGKAFGIYVDTGGYGGTYSSLYRGTCGDGIFESDGTEHVHFTSRSYLGITPGSMDTAAMDEGDLLNGMGKGHFAGGGTLECTELGGGSAGFEHEHWGVWWMEGKGDFVSPSSDDWTLAIGGQSSNPDPEGGTDAWVGTANGTRWNNNGLEGTFRGNFFHHDDAENVCGGNIFNGDLVGAYCDESFTWEAIGGGEWVEVTDLLSEANLGFTMTEFENFVTVPITEAYCSVVQGANANLDLNMDVHLYRNELNQIWTSAVTGTHSGSITDTWVLTLTNPEGHNLTLSGDQWSEGQWHALVSGNMPTESVNLTGEAGGTYGSDGSVEGVAGGTWSEGGALVGE